MKVYETTFILSPRADDAAFDRQVNAISNLISKFNGKLIHEDRWGVRRLAYPIQKFTQGYYTRLIFQGNSDLLNEMERLFKLEEPYIRYLTVIFDGNLEKYLPKKSEPEPAKTEAVKPAEKEESKAEPVEEAKTEEKAADDSASETKE